MILIIDDNALLCDTLRDFLALEGYPVDTALDGASGLGKLQRGGYDLVISDIKMPGLSGLDVLRAIRERSPDTEVILMTGYASLETAVEALRLGAYDYILKPFDHLDLVIKTIRRALEKQQLSREVTRQTRELQAAYAQLQVLEKMKGDLINMVVHDLRLPLFSLMGCLEYVQQNAHLTGQEARILSVAQQAGQQMTGLITEMLDISKLEEGRMPIVQAETDLQELIARTLAQVEALAAKNGVTLGVEFPARVPPVSVDQAVIGRVLLNLLSNALKFTPEGGRITVRGAVTGGTDELQIEVEDTGIGFEPDYQLKVFDKFEQAESRQQGQWLGIGLGLTFCKLAVEAHGGRIWAQSAPGQGSTFRFSLPLKPVAHPLGP